jgi:hypothetical protein
MVLVLMKTVTIAGHTLRQRVGVVAKLGVLYPGLFANV